MFFISCRTPLHGRKGRFGGSGTNQTHFVPLLIDLFEELGKALVVLFFYNAIPFDGLCCGYYFLNYFEVN